ncbi:long-chain fatty acid--CoA ligase [Saccharopolyspora sp. NPDC050642]|uniref:acyl-CoA synthetase n=1 Tax=Saccharopolyspora sp. NPDC050642 TaxID=3157099 RepID=UPI0033F6DA67
MYLTQGLHRSLQQHPDRPALVREGREHTFNELVDRVARLAAGLLELGLRRGDRVGILSANSAAFVELALACPWAGLVFAPVNGRWSLEEMAYQIDDAEIAVLVADEASLSTAWRLRARCPALSTVVADARTATSGDTVHYETLIAGSAPVPDCRMGRDELAGILYTGGTTGEPKGVMISSGGIMTSTLGTMASTGIVSPERFLHVAPLYHLAALGGVYQQVAVGSTHFVLPGFTVESLAEAIERFRITGTTLVPTMIQRLAEHAERTGCDLSSLRHLGYGASPISEALLRRVVRLLPQLDLCQRYGMTELGPVATVLSPADHRDDEHPERLRSAGRAARHAEVRVVGPDDDEQAVGEIGEIVVRGENVMLGYWKKPEETERALRGGWMHTGDLGYFDEAGYLYVVDRLKDMIVTGGENVYSAEVERVLSLHPEISACAVIGVPDLEWGERVHAVVVTAPGARPSAQEIREFCAARIARYKAPRTVDFVAELPRSAVGKILKRDLRARCATGEREEQPS